METLEPNGTSGERLADDDLELLIRVLPEGLAGPLAELPREGLVEVVMDLGRPPEARFSDGVAGLGDAPVTEDDLGFVVARLGEFSGDNRAGIERTLHRISAIRNRRGAIVGLTLRVGRAVFGTIDVLRDLVESGRNLLLMGPPGVGKTTKLREIARVLADDFKKRVMVVDTSNEIGGDGDVPHPAIGGARRMQVPRPDLQHAVMIEAVENHMPEVIIVDEIGTEAEAAAARTIAERGVQLIGTAHGNTLENLVLNPTLSDLVGGVAVVTLSDEEARRRGTAKTISERRAPPTFDIVVEMVARDEVIVHADTAEAVDRLLAGAPVGGERRRVDESGELQVEEVELESPGPLAPPPPRAGDGRGPTRIYPHALSPDLVRRALRDVGVDARLVARPDDADLILSLSARADDARVRRSADRMGLPVRTVKRNSTSAMRRVLQQHFAIVGGVDEEHVRDAVEEVEHAVRRVMAEGLPVALAPRTSSIRRLQHRLVSRYHLLAESMGTEPMRHLVIHPPG